LGDRSEHEKLIEQYLLEDNRAAAVQLLVELITKKAAQKKFEQAEFLRNKLFEVDAMALSAIVKTGEVIEIEKRNAIDQEHLVAWADFYKSLTTEETNALFYSMKIAKYPANRMIYRQGEMGSRLYFIDKGRLKMFYRQADKAILLKTLEAGEIFGEDTFFFSDGFCTTSVITDSPVKFYELRKDDLDKLNQKFPGLKSKVIDYCSAKLSVADLLQAKKLERRVAKRLNLPGKVLVQTLNHQDQPVSKPFKGELIDISNSGLAFIMKTTQNASEMLLGKKLNMKLTFDELASELEINRIGSVAAVNSEPFHEYVVHAEFNRTLENLVMDDLEDLMNFEAV
jgi:CRP-like cAMP-binding protein